MWADGLSSPGGVPRMRPIRFLMRCGQRVGGSDSAASGLPAPGPGGFFVDVRPLQGDRDLAAAAELAAQCRNGDPALAGRWSPAGLWAELTSREGRRVHGWLAWPAGQDPSVAPSAAGPAAGEALASGFGASSSGDRCPLGMVAVVDVGRQPIVRASIAWLLVHPAARRRGVGTALVRRALAEVGRLGGDVVSAETLPSWPEATAFWRRFAGDAAVATSCEDASHA